MLKTLQIKNVALIGEATIDFEKGLNVLSGETGSGKSVIIDSINFALGAKADKTMIRHGENECAVTAVFDISESSGAKQVLTDFGVEDSDEMIVTRKLSQDSKSSLRVNGIPFTLGMLKSVTSLLVDVHGQSEHYSLLKESEQLAVLDKFADKKLADLKAKCAELCSELKENLKKAEEFGGSESERAIKADILKFQIEEIENADIREGEEEELLVQKKKIQSAEKLAEAFSAVQNCLSGENFAIDNVNSAIRGISPVTGLDEEYQNIFDRLKAVAEELSDISATAEDSLSGLEFDDETADRIEDRLDKIKTLKRKYGQTEKDITDFAAKAREEYDKIINFDAEYLKLMQEKKRIISEISEVYNKISEERKRTAKKLIEKITAELRELGMKDAAFDVSFAPLETDENSSFGANGGDRIEFLFSANLGEPVKPMSKIISGGEMSRFMLSLKTVISSYHEISTYIFDEIDAGISGRTAETVAEKFAKISKNIQVIAISHLPQIVAFSDCSFKIAKYTDKDKTYTGIAKLSECEKIEELVRLIGGDMNSESAVTHAEEMVKKAFAYKNKI